VSLLLAGLTIPHPAAVRVGHDPEEILRHLDAWTKGKAIQ
jgi:hypothetical protein